MTTETKLDHFLDRSLMPSQFRAICEENNIMLPMIEHATKKPSIRFENGNVKTAYVSTRPLDFDGNKYIIFTYFWFSHPIENAMKGFGDEFLWELYANHYQIKKVG